jgi:hypothetical protein
MATKIKHTQSSPWVEPIGILSDFTAFLHYQNEAKNQSDNKLQIYDPNRDRYLNWISYDEENEYSSSVFSELQHDYSAFFSKNLVRNIISRSFDSQYKKKFTETIISTVFVDGEDNMATIMFAQLLSIDKDATLKILNQLFVDNYDNERVCIKILALLNDYTYERLNPYSQIIALASVSHKSSRIKSAAFNLFSHWGNKEALKLLNNVEPPSQAWILMKYNKIKKSLEERCSMQEK